ANPPPAPFPPELFGWFFIVIAGTIILLGWAYSIAMIVTARMLRRRRRHTFCMAMAGIACLWQPFGLALGIFSFIVLMRPSVQELFAEDAPPQAEPESEHERYHGEQT